MPKGKELKLVGADTGFFYCLKDGDQTAQEVLQDCDIVVSILTVFELRRAALKGNKPAWYQAQKFLEKFATIMDVNKEVAEKAAKISHGTGMPAIDSLILASLLTAGCKHIYTTDSHFETYKKKGIKIINLKI